MDTLHSAGDTYLCLRCKGGDPGSSMAIFQGLANFVQKLNIADAEAAISVGWQVAEGKLEDAGGGSLLQLCCCMSLHQGETYIGQSLLRQSPLPHRANSKRSCSSPAKRLPDTPPLPGLWV